MYVNVNARLGKGNNIYILKEFRLIESKEIPCKWVIDKDNNILSLDTNFTSDISVEQNELTYKLGELNGEIVAYESDWFLQEPNELIILDKLSNVDRAIEMINNVKTKAVSNNKEAVEYILNYYKA